MRPASPKSRRETDRYDVPMDGKWQVSQVHDELVPQCPSSGPDVLLLGRSRASLEKPR